jgi:hypothetical protein
MLGLPEEVDDYDYGLKMDDEPADETDGVKKEIVEDEAKVKAKNEKNAFNGEVYYPPEAFLMVTQVRGKAITNDKVEKRLFGLHFQC